MFLPALLLALPLVHAAAVDHHHPDSAPYSLPGDWFHPEEHPVHTLFRRAPGDGTQYPAVGTPQWSAGFPAAGTVPDPARLPQAWVDALRAAEQAGRIPNIPQSRNTPMTNPVYPAGFDPNGAQVCSSTYKCRIPGDLWDAPTGVFASSFDDGPQPLTTVLVDFLSAHNEKTTHFMIGWHILQYPNQFLTAFDAGHDIAVHTWSHPYMTTLSNLDIVGQLGWTMQLIHNSTGGRVPKYWRPPYGDSDMRVRSVAKEVFGLDTVIWNRDTLDWDASTPVIQGRILEFLNLPKTPGLMVLEHETHDRTVNAFMNAYPQIAATGWDFRSLAEVMGSGRSYQNAASSSSDDVQRKGVVAGGASPPSSSSSSSSVRPSSSSGQSTSPDALPTDTSPSGQSPPSPTGAASSLTDSRQLSSVIAVGLAVLLFLS